METTNRNRQTALVQLLNKNLHKIDTWQVLRILNRNLLRQGKDSSYLSFEVDAHLRFAENEIVSIRERNEELLITINFMGLIGASGILPTHYTELIIKQRKLLNNLLKAFIDKVNNRSIQIYFQSWQKNRLYIQYENAYFDLGKNENGAGFLRALSAVINAKDPIVEKVLASHQQFFSNAIKSAANFKEILKSTLHYPVTIEEFSKRIDKLPLDSGEIRLGQNFVIGDSVRMDAQHITVFIHCLNPELKGFCYFDTSKLQDKVKKLSLAFFGNEIKVSTKFSTLSQEVLRSDAQLRNASAFMGEALAL